MIKKIRLFLWKLLSQFWRVLLMLRRWGWVCIRSALWAIVWFVWEPVGVRAIWEKFRPPGPDDKRRKAPTFGIWILALYFATFEIGTNRYQNRLDRLENRTAILVTQLNVPNPSKALIGQIADVQSTTVPVPPDLFDPGSLINAAFFPGEGHRDSTTIEILKKTVESLNRDSVLVGANLLGARLLGADLLGARLLGARLLGADLLGARLLGARLLGARLLGADLLGADLSDANLLNADLSDANLSRAYLRGADLRDAFLLGADLRDAFLRGADLRDAFLLGADLRDAFLLGADLRDAFLLGADLRGADLRGADLSGARNLTKVQIESARTDSTTILPDYLKD